MRRRSPRRRLAPRPTTTPPTVRGTLGAGNPTEVLIFATANCKEPTLARATAAEFTGTGIAITVGDNTTTPLSAMAIGESYSGCSNTISYIEDSLATEHPDRLRA